MFGLKFNGKGGPLSKQLKLSKQVITILHSAVQPDAARARTSGTFLCAVALHAMPFLIPHSWLPTSKEANPSSDSVRVKIVAREAQSNPTTNFPIRDKKSTAEKKHNEIKKTLPKTLTTAEQSTAFQTPLEFPRDSKPNSDPQGPTTSPATPPEKTLLPAERTSPILPSGKDDFLAHQRNLGDVIGAGAIAGDLEVPDVISEKDPNEPVTRTDYTFAGYFDNLSRRFADAWGGVRTLPPQSRFEGKLGEFIEYDIVINRDGSLRKIVNISAKRQPYRDFAAVDDLVGGVFKSMFPFAPVPTRIRNDPLVVRKRIQFVGFKYTLY